MDDERLLAEALRAHAAGGVSNPGGTVGTGRVTPPEAPGDVPDNPSSRLRERFRPLGRVTRSAPAGGSGPAAGSGQAGGPDAPHLTAAVGRPGGPARPASGPPPGGPPPARGPFGPAGGPGPGIPPPRRPPQPPPEATPHPDPEWTPARIAWWAGVALVGGAVVGALAAVATLVLPG